MKVRDHNRFALATGMVRSGSSDLANINTKTGSLIPFYIILTAWQIPPLPKLSRYASLATSFLLTQIPILVRPYCRRTLFLDGTNEIRWVQHRPTMFNTEMTPQVAFALAVAGAGLETEGTEFHGNMVKEKRIFAIHHLHELELTELEMFSVLQSLSVYNYLGLYHEDPMRESPTVFHQAKLNLLSSYDPERTYSAASHAVLISVRSRPLRVRPLPSQS